MPGLAASSRIFEYIVFEEDKFEKHLLEWIAPDDEQESLADYAKKYVALIKHKNPVLVGVSFGGILVQEISKLMAVQQVIIISSIKSDSEMPKRLKVLRKLGIYKLFPSHKLSKIDDFSKFEIHPKLKKKGELYNKYMSRRDEKYLNWAIRNVLFWKCDDSRADLIHIHGSKDEIFPIKHIKNCISIEGGTHAMIILKAKQISKIIENQLLK